ncbi:MAG TPA: efflux RND transporter periplasmic adaptor subunit [Candidatus Krumholzibacteria bacterium]|nr:efflux RND transporter periplasmic adaptor subunit [Candidatus Krumholzibacteria bacterium]
MTRRLVLPMLFALLVVACHRAPQEEEKAPPAAEKNVVKLAPEAVHNAGIESVVVARGKVDVPLVVPGHLSFDVNRTGQVTSTLDGRITQMNYDVGRQVGKGDVMVLVDAPDLLHPLELKAPMAGRVVERHGAVGELIDKATPLYTISDVATLWCIGNVNESDMSLIKLGQPATVTVLPYPGDKFYGRVIRVGDSVNEQTHTLEVRIEVQNQGDMLKAGMFANAALRTTSSAEGLFVPDASVQNVGGRSTVFVEEAPGTYRATEVRLGREIGTMHEVLDGLTAGVHVVTTGSFILKSELLKGEIEG